MNTNRGWTPTEHRQCHVDSDSDVNLSTQAMQAWANYQAQCRRNLHCSRLILAEKMLLEKAAKCELWAVRNLLRIVSEAIAEGVVLTPKIALFVSTALRRIHDGKKADDAFGIKRKRGEKDQRAARNRQFMLAYAVEQLRESGKKLEDARQTVEEKAGISENTIQKAWIKYRKEARRHINLEIKALGRVMPITLP